MEIKMQALAISQNEEEEKVDSSQTTSKYATDPEVLLDLKEDKINSVLHSAEEETRNSYGRYRKFNQADLFYWEIFCPIISFPSSEHRVNRMVSLQKWEGYVLRVLKDSLWVRLIDLTHQAPDAEGEIQLDEITQDDFELIKPGAIFYWNIGYLDLYSGTRQRSSIIRFQRLPVWSSEEIDVGRREAERFPKSP